MTRRSGVPLSDGADSVRDRQVAAHAEAEREDLERLRSLSMKERGELISLACEAAAEILRSRRAAGLPDPSPDPWPQSTWDFFRKACRRD